MTGTKKIVRFAKKHKIIDQLEPEDSIFESLLLSSVMHSMDTPAENSTTQGVEVAGRCNTWVNQTTTKAEEAAIWLTADVLHDAPYFFLCLAEGLAEEARKRKEDKLAKENGVEPQY
mmetsp:Transcript_14498/g.21317  ORF Transcript_14498/g.21317 Transcript_14498/m.21317 type:complete len:117 (-) Transcript_14498:692-1042(-)|eukprot:CAMPEP_0194029938 /NCGR_PEP_ID=MMETSP0009_2-20130614/3560_1 /TAXON_ID=210454 /ORGANISM="Grammatophora oceanica, Strain CCMP 410" /LENGTH=116 /DNA_ID=CAMNT_0038669763 /DNA_START=69 /DNA_END=419 /DNA_ORIENTATION=-